MAMLHFTDRDIPYKVFIKDMVAEIVHALKDDSNDPEYISQRKAYSMFGRSNVGRWRDQGRITPLRRPGKVEYRTADLRFLQRKEQDYFEEGL